MHDKERKNIAGAIRIILQGEIEDANPRIAKQEVNPLYWLQRRFEQLADEIESDDYHYILEDDIYAKE